MFYSKSFNTFNYGANITIDTPIAEYIEQHKQDNIGFYYTRVITNFGNRALLTEIDDIKIYQHNDFEFDSVANIAKTQQIPIDAVYSKYFTCIFMVTNAQTSILTKVNKIVNLKQESVRIFV